MMEARKAELAARRRPEDVDYSAARCEWIGSGVIFPQRPSRFVFRLSRLRIQPVPASYSAHPLFPFAPPLVPVPSDELRRIASPHREGPRQDR
jgi:hypothetical protein